MLLRLRCSNALRKETLCLLGEQTLIPAQEPQARRVQARRLLGRLEPETLRRLIALCSALRPKEASNLAALQAEAEALDRQDVCCRVGQLAVDGRDLMALGIPAGPGLRRVLGELLEQVVTETLPNEREPLLAAASRKAP